MPIWFMYRNYSELLRKGRAMTRKDYELIASVIKKYVRAYEELEDGKEQNFKLQACGGIMSEMARELEALNPRFNRERFVEACGFVLFRAGVK